jgi:hypothetical protein
MATAALSTPPSHAADALAVRSVAGPPQLSLADGRADAWRNVGVVAEIDLVEVEAKLAARIPFAGPALTGIASAGGEGRPDAEATAGREVKATLRLPRWSADAPLVDLTLRRWRLPMRAADATEGSSGSTAEVGVTHPLGSVDMFYGYTLPFASRNAEGSWRSFFAGVSWYAARRTTIELVADRGSNAATGLVDRTVTLRVRYATGGARVSAWAMRAFDDRTQALRAGVGVDYAF